MDIEKNKQTFIDIYKSSITREGSAELLNYLLSSDFFTAPASTKYHSCEEGGLCFHSINAYKRLINIVEQEKGENWQEEINPESVAIIGLLHDICKTNYYKQEMRNVKVDGVWQQVPYYSVEDNLPYGHGEKSVYMISGFMKLTRDEAMAINWHMGAADARCRNGSSEYSNAFYAFPLAFMFHIADMEATFLDEHK